MKTENRNGKWMSALGFRNSKIGIRLTLSTFPVFWSSDDTVSVCEPEC